MFSGVNSSGFGRGLSSHGTISNAAMSEAIRIITLLYAWCFPGQTLRSYCQPLPWSLNITYYLPASKSESIVQRVWCVVKQWTISRKETLWLKRERVRVNRLVMGDCPKNDTINPNKRIDDKSFANQTLGRTIQPFGIWYPWYSSCAFVQWAKPAVMRQPAICYCRSVGSRPTQWSDWVPPKYFSHDSMNIRNGFDLVRFWKSIPANSLNQG